MAHRKQKKQFNRMVERAHRHTKETGEGAFVFWDTIHPQGYPGWNWITEHDYYHTWGKGIPESEVVYHTYEGAYS